MTEAQNEAMKARIVKVEDTGRTYKGSPVITVTCACKTDGLSGCDCTTAVINPTRYAERVAAAKAATA